VRHELVGRIVKAYDQRSKRPFNSKTTLDSQSAQ
jgi:phosphate starvation-inducible protein PhoH